VNASLKVDDFLYTAYGIRNQNDSIKTNQITDPSKKGSGLIFPVENIPAGLRWISIFIWGRYYIEIVRDALLQGGGWPAIGRNVAIIGFIGAVFYTVAWRGMRRMQLEA